MTELSPTNMEEAVAGPDPRDAQIRGMVLAMMRSLVEEPDKVELIHVATAEGVAFQVRSAAKDVGKLIGKSGRTARAIRTILGACAANHRRRYTLDIGQ